VVAEVDDPQAEEQAYYRKKMGRWRREARDTIKDEDFWDVLSIVAASHSPLDHHFNFMHSGDYKFKLGAFICGKADDILAEFDSFFTPAAWASDLVDNVPLQRHGTVSDLLLLGVEINLCHHAGYFRRIAARTKKYPYRAFWLAHMPPEYSCATRRQVASEILAIPADELETNIGKLVQLCSAELEHAATQGTCGVILYTIVRGWYEEAKGDVSSNEGHNSCIRRECERNRNIGLPLLSARCNSKKELQVGSRGSKSKWSAIRGRAFSVLQDGLLLHSGGLVVVVNRFLD
jgi:hypothetical protein